MVGSGSPVFAVWGYVISKMQPDKEVGAQVELNPKLLAFIIGDEEEVIEGAIRKLCAKDENSRSPEHDGRRLIKVGQFAYQVVNAAKYLGLRNLDEKRAGDRERKARSRALRKGKPLAGEVAAVKAMENGDEAGAARIAAERVDKVDLEANMPPEADAVVGRPVQTSADVREVDAGSMSRAPGRWVDGDWVPD